MTRTFHKLILATNNRHKISEMSAVMEGLEIELLSKADFSDFPDIPETGTTLEENALLKARAVFEKYGIAAIADDTGLMVAALSGAPGIYSARYAGEQCSFLDNNLKLLAELQGVAQPDRSASFVTVIALVDGEGEHCFTGEVHGVITTELMGENGFGYDPVFLPNESNKTFAQMSAAEKNAISHRGRALKQLRDWLARH